MDLSAAAQDDLHLVVRETQVVEQAIGCDERFHPFDSLVADGVRDMQRGERSVMSDRLAVHYATPPACAGRVDLIGAGPF
jgi:hypothetical protein